MAKAQVGRWVLDQQPSPERLLRVADAPAENLKALLGVGKRQQIIQVSPADCAPSQVLGDQHRLDPPDQLFEAGEMNAVEVLAAPPGERNPREADAVGGA